MNIEDELFNLIISKKGCVYVYHPALLLYIEHMHKNRNSTLSIDLFVTQYKDGKWSLFKWLKGAKFNAENTNHSILKRKPRQTYPTHPDDIALCLKDSWTMDLMNALLSYRKTGNAQALIYAIAKFKRLRHLI